MPLVLDTDFFVLGIAVGVLGLVFLLSLIVAFAYDEPTLFFLAGYLACIVAVLLAGKRWQMSMDLLQNLLLIAGSLTVASLQIWVLKDRKNTLLSKLVMAVIVLTSVGLMIFYGLAEEPIGNSDRLAVGLSLGWAVIMVVGVSHLTFQSWFAAGPWKWWLIFGQFLGLAVAALFLANVVNATQVYWPVVLMLLVQVPLIYLSLVWRSRLLNEIRLRSAAAGVTDPLTGLATTPVLLELLLRVMARSQQIKRAQSSSALFLIEVQNWHGLIAELGVDFNEKLLLESAMRLRRSVGDNDMVARIAGGRFAVVAQGLASQKEITELATRLVVSGLRIDSPLLPGVELKFRLIVMNIHPGAPLALLKAQAWLDSLVGLFKVWPPTHRSRSILVVEQGDGVMNRPSTNSNY